MNKIAEGATQDLMNKLLPILTEFADDNGIAI